MYKVIYRLLEGDHSFKHLDKKSNGVWMTHCYKTLDAAVGYIQMGKTY